MDIDILHRPAQAVAEVRLDAGESLTAESGALVGMSPSLSIETGAGGIMKGLKRLFGGESFFRNTFRATRGPGRVFLAAALPGDMTVLDATPPGWRVQSTSYVASTPGVDVDTEFGGLRTFFAGEGLFVLRASGAGKVIVGAYGALERVEVDGELVVDTGHLVAWQADLPFRIGKAAEGWIASFLSGEGLVCRFEGRGTIWLQTRNPSAFGQELGRLLPPRSE
jgi:uncharacterized protein (TIGR00266 family)